MEVRDGFGRIVRGGEVAMKFAGVLFVVDGGVVGGNVGDTA